MPKSIDSKPVALSRKLYERLLAAYPKNHRREYGAAMTQLFLDQCRDAWAEARGWGLAAFWGRVSVDLIKTSAAEHFRNLKQRKSMFSNILLAFRTNPTLRTTFLALFALTFLLVLGASLLLTFLMPEMYASTARIKVERDQATTAGQANQQVIAGWDPYFIQSEFQVLQSELILGQVIKELDLNREWGRKYAGGQPLKTAETVALLKARMDLRPVRNTSLIEVRVFSENNQEAARIANAIVEAYRDSRRAARVAAQPAGTLNDRAEILDRAVPGLRPVRPNKPFNIFLGLFGGIIVASLVGGAGALVVILIRRFSRAQNAMA
jgi:capsular polysaccharide biosynthesis protein